MPSSRLLVTTLDILAGFGDTTMHYLVAQLVSICTLFGMADPKAIHDYIEIGVSYAHTVTPADRVLTREELDRWMERLVASDEQGHVINALYEAYVADRHNPYLDEEMPGFLAKAAEIASYLEVDGTESSGYLEASLESERLATRIAHMVEQFELQFIESLEPILAPEQIDTLFVFRLQALRRKCSSVTMGYRWLELELRDVCDVLPATAMNQDDVHSIRAGLMSYEDELTLLLRHWLSARLEAGRRARRYWYDVARGAVEPTRGSAAIPWERPAEVARRIRFLQMRTLEDLLVDLSSDAAAMLHTNAKERIFPELYPDPLYGAVKEMLAGVIDDADVSADVRGVATVALAFYRQEYAEICGRLEAFCIEWDDGAHLGTGDYRRNDFPHSLTPLLEERAQLSNETMRRFEEEKAYRARVR